MITIGLSQHQADCPAWGERRDALDLRWSCLMRACGFAAVPLPSDLETAVWIAERLDLAGIILTGGDNPMSLGGASSRRELCELTLLNWTRERGKPLLGICRGMELLLLNFGNELSSVAGHAGAMHEVNFGGHSRTVNSFHRLAAYDVRPPLVALAHGGGVIEAIRHCNEAIYGWMWHPERREPFQSADIAELHRIFGAEDR